MDTSTLGKSQISANQKLTHFKNFYGILLRTRSLSKPIAMRHTQYIVLLLTLFSPFLAGSQYLPTHVSANQNDTSIPPHRCAADEARTKIMGIHPYLAQKESEMNSRIRALQSSRDDREEDQYISVVVHIIHNNGEENISDATVMQGIQDLNDAFSNTGDYFSEDGEDSHIRFCLAQQDPNGLPTTGINRMESSLTNMVMEIDDITLKDLSRWDTEHYLNIWLVSEIYSTSMGNSVAGYAFLPYSHGMPEDGIVNEAKWFGANTNYSKVHIHEAGHYLGLYHTFQSGCINNDCTLDGDLVCDTPPDGSVASSLCGITQNTCNSDEDDTSNNNPFRSVQLGGLGDQNDMVENYMDYSNQNCQNLFSAGQIDRMIAALNSERSSLLQSNGCISSCGIGMASILGNEFEFISGESFVIEQNTLLDIPVNFTWHFNGSLISTDDSLLYTFSNTDVGENYLVFTVSSLTGDCVKQDSVLVRVRCNPAAAFTMYPQYIDVNQEVTFTSSSSEATAYEWYLDQQLVGTDQSLNITFDEGGSHRLFLVTGNGACTDTSAIDYFVAGTCFGGQNNHWIFGQTNGIELDFSSGSPVPSLIPEDDLNALQTIEGVATISDQNGELLFYSDGSRLFNKNYEAFYSGLGAGGSSAQGVQIVPDPGNMNRYYVFTAEHFAGTVSPNGSGYSYVIVDMSVNNGLGGVVSNYTQLIETVSERQTAIRHCNGEDAWIICHEMNNNNFYSFLLTDEGLSAPVISQVGPIYDIIWFLGCMVSSPLGNTIALSGYGGVSLYHFDNETGIVSDQYPLTNNTNYISSYGISFSPDGSKLYFNRGEGTPEISQIDLSSGNDQIIANSITTVGISNRPYYLGAMQLGPDGKIYIAQSSGNHLDIIHHPDESGEACGFETDGLELPGYLFYGLNNTLSAPVLPPGPQITGITSICENASGVNYTANCGNNEWSYHGHGTMTLLSSTEVEIDFTQPGIDTLICSALNLCSGFRSDTLLIHVGDPDIFLGNDTTICSTGQIELALSETQFVSYLWSNGNNADHIVVSDPGNYWLAATSEGGCVARDTIHVYNFYQPFDVPDESMEICGIYNNYVDIEVPVTEYEHHWFYLEGLSSNTLNIYVDIIYGPWDIPVFYINDLGCVDESHIALNIRGALPTDFLNNELVMCEGEVEVISFEDSVCPECTYTWQDGSTDDPYTIYSPQSGQFANYFVTRYDPLCNLYDAIEYITAYSLEPELISLPDTVYVCEQQQVFLSTGNNLITNYEWQDGSTEQYYQVSIPGTYWVQSNTECGIFADTTEALPFPVAQIDLPDTLHLCSGQLPYYLNPNNNLFNYQWSNGGGGYAYDEGKIIAYAQTYCGSAIDSVYIDVSPSPFNNIPDEYNSCMDTTIVFSLPENQINTWENIEQNSIEINTAGVYHYTTQHASGCIVSDSVVVNYYELFFEIPDSTLCEGSLLTFDPISSVPDWLWMGEYQPEEIVIADTGTYWAFNSNNVCFRAYTFHITYENQNYTLTLPDSLSVCDSALPIIIEATGDEALSYLWDNGNTSSELAAEDIGWHVLTALYDCGQQSDSTYLSILPEPTTLLPQSAILCDQSELTLIAGTEYNNEWSNGSTSDTLVISEPGLYTLTSAANNGCISVDSTNVVASDLYVNLPEDLFICANSSTNISAQTNGSEYFWSTGESALEINIQMPGTYVFSASQGECTQTAELDVFFWPISTFSLGEDTIVSASEFTIEGPAGFSAYEWNVIDETSSNIVVSQSGTYTLTAWDENECSYIDEITVLFDRPSLDSFIKVPDVFSQNLIATYNNVSVYDIKIFDDIGRLVSYGNTFPVIWDGNVQGNSASSGMYFYLINYSDINGVKKILKGNSLLVR